MTGPHYVTLSGPGTVFGSFGPFDSSEAAVEFAAQYSDVCVARAIPLAHPSEAGLAVHVGLETVVERYGRGELARFQARIALRQIRAEAGQ